MTTSLINFAMVTSWRIWKWTQILFIQRYRMRTFKIELDVLKKKNGRLCEIRPVMIHSEKVPHRMFSLEHAAQSIRSTKNESQDSSKKKADVPKWFVSAAKFFLTLVPNLTVKILVAKVSTKKNLFSIHWSIPRRRLGTDQWKNIDL